MFNHFTEVERELLQARARQIAVNKQDGETDDALQALRCKVGQGWYAIPLDRLSAIYHQVTVTPIPDAPPRLNGVTNVRGRILPVLDLGVLLGMEATTTPQAELIVIQHAEGLVALQVREVDDVMIYRAAELEVVPEEMQTVATVSAFADGTLLLDTAPLLDDPQVVIDTQVK